MDNATNGAFISSLKRNNKQIRDNCATAICEDTEFIFRREIENLVFHMAVLDLRKGV